MSSKSSVLLFRQDSDAVVVVMDHRLNQKEANAIEDAVASYVDSVQYKNVVQLVNDVLAEKPPLLKLKVNYQYEI